MNSKILTLIVTRDDQEAVLTVYHRKCYANEFGEIVPPIMVEYEGLDYMLKRSSDLGDTYIYSLPNWGDTNDILVKASS